MHHVRPVATALALLLVLPSAARAQTPGPSPEAGEPAIADVRPKPRPKPRREQAEPQRTRRDAPDATAQAVPRVPEVRRPVDPKSSRPAVAPAALPVVPVTAAAPPVGPTSARTEVEAGAPERPATPPPFPTAVLAPQEVRVPAGVPMALTPGALTPLSARAAAWSAEGLPDGLTLGDDGVVTGVAARKGRSAVTFVATLSDGRRVEARTTLVVVDDASAASASKPRPGLAAVPDMTIAAGRPFRTATPLLVPTGANPTPSDARPVGSPPPGLEVTPDGMLFGTPSAPGTYRFALEANEGDAKVATNPFSVTVK